MTRAEQVAREAYAVEIEKMGPAWRNTADNVRAGFENCWIIPAVRAVEAVLRRVPDDEDDPEEVGSRAADRA